MTFGARIYNAGGAVTIDSTYKNLTLRQKNAFGFIGATQEVTITYAAPNIPLLFIKSSGMAGLMEAGFSGGNYYWVVRAADGGSDITTYVFDTPAPATGTHGVRVFNDTGGLVFDSNQKYMRVIDAIPLSFSPGSRPDAARGYPAAEYAVCIGQPRGRIQGATNNMQTDSIHTDATGVIVRNNMIKSFNGPWSTHTGVVVGTGTTYALVADVSYM